jgi:Uncharacterized protein conserved in bacteria
VAFAILDGIEAGQEDIFPDPFAVDFGRRFESSPKASERQVAAMTGGDVIGLSGVSRRRSNVAPFHKGEIRWQQAKRETRSTKGHLAMNTPPIVSQQEWEAARQQLLVKEKALTRSRDALAAERRRMPWLAWRRSTSSTAQGQGSLLDLFEGRRS